MAGVDATQIVVPGNAVISVAPYPTAVPSSTAGTFGTDLGLTTPDGTNFAFEPTFGEVRSHQSAYATRIFKTADKATLHVVLQQVNGDVLKAVFGGGTVSGSSFAPPGPEESAPIAAVLTAIDGVLIVRLVIPRCRARSAVTLPLSKTKEIELPLALEVEGGIVGVSPWDLYKSTAF